MIDPNQFFFLDQFNNGLIVHFFKSKLFVSNARVTNFLYVYSFCVVHIEFIEDKLHLYGLRKTAVSGLGKIEICSVPMDELLNQTTWLSFSHPRRLHVADVQSTSSNPRLIQSH